MVSKAFWMSRQFYLLVLWPYERQLTRLNGGDEIDWHGEQSGMLIFDS